MFCDTHFHFEDIDDKNTILSNARDVGVGLFILAGTNKEDNIDNLKISLSNDDVFVCCGFHPSEASFISFSDLENLKDLISNNKKKIVGIGEIGLDYHYGNENKERQLWLFEEQIKIAIYFGLPIVVHTRDAYLDTYKLLKKYFGKVKGIIHCFSGSFEVAKSYVDLGYLLGIGGVVTFHNSHLKDTLKNISLDKIVLETDSPYLSPYRGQRNEPKNIIEIATFLTNVYGVGIEKIENMTFLNVKNTFFSK